MASDKMVFTIAFGYESGDKLESVTSYVTSWHEEERSLHVSVDEDIDAQGVVDSVRLSEGSSLGSKFINVTYIDGSGEAFDFVEYEMVNVSDNFLSFGDDISIDSAVVVGNSSAELSAEDFSDLEIIGFDDSLNYEEVFSIGDFVGNLSAVELVQGGILDISNNAHEDSSSLSSIAIGETSTEGDVAVAMSIANKDGIV